MYDGWCGGCVWAALDNFVTWWCALMCWMHVLCLLIASVWNVCAWERYPRKLDSGVGIYNVQLAHQNTNKHKEKDSQRPLRRRPHNTPDRNHAKITSSACRCLTWHFIGITVCACG